MLTLRSDDGRRIIAGIAVPWDEAARLANGRTERVVAGGAVMREEPPPVLRHEHRTVPIGSLLRSVDAPEGLWTEWLLLDSPSARDAWTAAEAGLVRGMSIEMARDNVPIGGGGALSGISIIGVALTERPIYTGARITEVRSRIAARPRLTEWASIVDEIEES